MSSCIEQTNSILTVWKSTMEIRITKLRQENKPGSMQNYKNRERELNKMIVLKVLKKRRNRKKFAVLKLRELKDYERMIYSRRIEGKPVHSEFAYSSNSGTAR